MTFETQSLGLKSNVAEPFVLCLERKLGAEVSASGTQFALWAPSATAVTLRLFSCGSTEEAGDHLLGTYPMTVNPDGAWTTHFDHNMHGVYYDFMVRFADGTEQRAADPYARAAGVNGQRSMVVDLALTNPDGWENDVRPNTPVEQLVVWETHVNAFSSDEHGGFPREHMGKYLAFTDTDTSLDGNGAMPTGVAYLKKLGVTAVQLMPIFDYGSVDERFDNGFNWGYDPVNYNVPEGSYATNPFDGTVRIHECKRMIQALHEAGIKVIMDVVYNHMYSADNWFERTVPGYFMRRWHDGNLSNGSGCGNDMASERAMFRRYMVESVTYWAREYHMDGFRFDLMGLIDTDTMNAVRASLDKLDGGENIIMYGEPWSAGPTALLPGFTLADDTGWNQLDERIGHFCARTRDSIKGHVFYTQERGYVNGQAQRFEPEVRLASNAWRNHADWQGNAGQIIQYVSAHDNLTLWDKLVLSMYGNGSSDETRALFDAQPSTNEANVLAANQMAAALVQTAAGIPFMLSGEEFAKTKYGNDNSYDSGSEVNRLDWSRAYRLRDLVKYYARLIELRTTPSDYSTPSDWFEAPRVQFTVPGSSIGFRFANMAVLVNPEMVEHYVPVERLDRAVPHVNEGDEEQPEFELNDSRILQPNASSKLVWRCIFDSAQELVGAMQLAGHDDDDQLILLPRSVSIWRLEPAPEMRARHSA